MILQLILRPQEFVFPEPAPNSLTIAVRRRDAMSLPFRQLNALIRGWQGLKDEGQQKGYRCLENQGDGEMATLFFYRSDDEQSHRPEREEGMDLVAKMPRILDPMFRE